jgi:hypothetical protein
LYVQLVGGDQPLQLTHDRTALICCANWSPDGRQIAFGRCDDHGGGIYIVPALGGEEWKVTDVKCTSGEAGWPNWTADGRSIVIADECKSGDPPGIVLFSYQQVRNSVCTLRPQMTPRSQSRLIARSKKNCIFRTVNSGLRSAVHRISLWRSSPKSTWC